MKSETRRTRGADGFTLIEILVVITIMAALMGLVAATIPIAISASNQARCTNNLQQIGSILSTMKSGGQMESYSGAAFLLQAAQHVNDADLEVFICPGEEDDPQNARPSDGSEEFIALYRDEMDLKNGKFDTRHCSYAGPDLKGHPLARTGRDSKRIRFWACDRCRNGLAHHDGLAVLFSTSKVAVLDLSELTGHSEEEGRIHVGEGSPDSRLEAMTFLPPR